MAIYIVLQCKFCSLEAVWRSLRIPEVWKKFGQWIDSRLLDSSVELFHSLADERKDR